MQTLLNNQAAYRQDDDTAEGSTIIWRVSFRSEEWEDMPEKKEKIVSYRHAEWLTPTSNTLAGFIKQAKNKLKDVSQRTIARDNGQVMRLASIRSDRQDGHYLHITAETPGEAASVVPKIRRPTEEIEVGTTAPPSDAEFMDGDSFLYVRDNDVCLCGTGVHDATVRYFLFALFRAAQLTPSASHFELLKVAQISKLKLLQTQGVKEIELRSTVYAATMNYHRRRTQTQGLVGIVAKHMKAIFGNEHDANEDALRVMLTVATDGRRKGLKLGDKRIQALATDLIKNQEEEDDYVIITKTGQRIGPKEIFIRSKVAIDSQGKSVQRDKAWKELKIFYNMMSESGALGQ